MEARDTGRRRAVFRPYLVEITGVAGAGKSTLCTALCAADAGYERAEFVRTRRPAHLVYVLRSTPRLLPVLAASVVLKPRMSWADVKLMVYVTGWRRFLSRRHNDSDATVVLDQGPIYALVRLKAQDRGVTPSRWFQRWWNEMLAQWVEALSAIVWLDAPDAVLRARIDDRAQPHTVKGAAGAAGQQFIARYRLLFQEVLDHIELAGTPKLWRLDTSDTPVEQLVAEVRSSLESERDTSGRPGHGRDISDE